MSHETGRNWESFFSFRVTQSDPEVIGVQLDSQRLGPRLSELDLAI